MTTATEQGPAATWAAVTRWRLPSGKEIAVGDKIAVRPRGKKGRFLRGVVTCIRNGYLSCGGVADSQDFIAGVNEDEIWRINAHSFDPEERLTE